MNPILDMCCGSRMFWFDKKDPRATFMDHRDMDAVLCDGRTLSIHPDIIGDFREIPFENSSFHHVVFDPPHLLQAGEDSWLANKYGVLNRGTWKDDLRQGFDEGLRVLKPNSIMNFKWSEDQVSTAEVISLFSIKPLYGFRRGKSVFLTYWKGE